jgi:hypothetical protein
MFQVEEEQVVRIETRISPPTIPLAKAGIICETGEVGRHAAVIEDNDSVKTSREIFCTSFKISGLPSDVHFDRWERLL